MGIDNIIQGQFGKRPQHPQKPPFEMRLGESTNAIICGSCGNLRKAGMFVIAGNVVCLLCVNCLAQGLEKYQKMSLGKEAVFQIDAEVPPEVMRQVIDAVVKENSDLPEERVARIAKSAIEKI